MALRFIPGLERSKAAPVTEARVRKLIADAGGGGGGGPVAWGDVTGKPSVFPPDTELVDDRVAALLAAGANITLTYNDVTNTLTIAATGASALSFQTAEVNLGSTARRSGRFTLPGVGMTVGKPVLVQQAVGPYTGKGARADEAEMDQMTVAASVTSPTVITAYWRASGPMKGNVKVNYLVGA